VVEGLNIMADDGLVGFVELEVELHDCTSYVLVKANKIDVVDLMGNLISGVELDQELDSFGLAQVELGHAFDGLVENSAIYSDQGEGDDSFVLV